jgi:hypothetical protein
MNAKQRYLEKVKDKKIRHPIAGQEILWFILAMCFFGVSVILIGVCNMPVKAWQGSVARLGLSVFTVVVLQCSVIFSAFSVNSTRYALHCIASTTLALSLALDIGLAIYYYIILF